MDGTVIPQPDEFEFDEEENGDLQDEVDTAFDALAGEVGRELTESANFALSVEGIQQQEAEDEESDEEFEAHTFTPKSILKNNPMSKSVHFQEPPNPYKSPPPGTPIVKMPSAISDSPKLPPKVAAQGKKMLEEKLLSNKATIREKRIYKIKQYYKSFPKLLEDAPKKGKLDANTSDKVVADEEERINRHLSGGNAYNSLKTLDLLFTHWAMEKPMVAFGLPVQGLTAAAKMSQDVVDQELRELAIEYEDFFSTGPHFRYLMKKLWLINEVMKRNVQGGDMGSAVDEEKKEELNNRFGNL
jgi:hypothetical protein